MELRSEYQCSSDGSEERTTLIAVIPALNEERSIGSVVALARQHVDTVVVVDDGSDDRTAAVAELAGALCVRQRNQGYGSAIQRGFQEALGLGATIVVLLDGDLQHDPSEIPKMVAPLQQHEADIVIGNRYLANEVEVPRLRRLGQIALSSLGTAGGAARVADSQNGFRAFTREALMQLGQLSKGMGFASEILFAAKELDLKIVEAPTAIRYFAEQRRNIFAHGIEVLDAILSQIARRRPILFLGLPGFVISILGVLLGLHVAVVMARSRTMLVGSSVLTAILLLGGLLLCVAALLLNTLEHVSGQVSSDVVRKLHPLPTWHVEDDGEPYDSSGYAAEQKSVRGHLGDA